MFFSIFQNPGGATARQQGWCLEMIDPNDVTDVADMQGGSGFDPTTTSEQGQRNTPVDWAI